MARGLLLVAGFVGALGLVGSAHPQQQKNTPLASAKAGGTSADEPMPAVVPPRAIRNAGGEDNAADIGDEGRALSPWYDLSAQLVMALSAVAQLFLTGLGIWYVRKTLRATEAAVEEAQKGSDAAVKMAAAAHDQFLIERRPWMAQQKLEAVKPITHMEFAFKVHFRNVGASPAFDVAVVFDMDVDDYSFTKSEAAYDNFLQTRKASHRGGEVVFPGGDHIATHHLQFSKRDLERRDEAWAKRQTKKPGITPRVFYAVFYRSPIIGEDGTRSVHHTGGFFSLHDWKGPIIVDGPNPPDLVTMISNRTNADFLVR